MSFIGNTPTQQAFTPAVDYFNGTGSATVFTLSRPVASTAQVQVTIENVPQNPSSSFTVSGNTITFTSAPPSGTNNIYVQYTSLITQILTTSSLGEFSTLTTTGNVIHSTNASGSVLVTATAAPTVDMVNITNTSFPNVTAGVSCIQFDYAGGAAAVEGAATRTNITPGGTTGGIWSGHRIVPGAAGTGVTLNGVKFDTKSTGLGTSNALWCGTGWDSIINYNGTALINGTGGAAFTNLTTSAGTTAIAPITLTSGTNLTAAVAGATEYDGTNLYFTQGTTQGRGVVPTCQQFYLSAAGSALSTAITPFFNANSAISLAAASTYYIEACCYFLKTTAGTATWTHTISSAATLAHSIIEYTPITGFTTAIITGAMVTTEATQQTSTALVHTVTGSLTTAVYHLAKFKTCITTNLACNYRLQVTQSAGTITPQAGSYYKITRVGGTAGNFVA